MIKIIEPFVLFKDTADVKQVHQLFGADLCLTSLSVQFNEFIHNLDDEISIESMSLHDLIKKFGPTLSKDYNELFVVLCEIFFLKTISRWISMLKRLVVH